MNNSLIYLAIALGGAIGACSRYGLSMWINKQIDGTFPWATLSVNLIGGFLIGALYWLLQEKVIAVEWLKPLLITGFLGGLTTFSTFSLEAVQLIQQGLLLQAVMYMLVSVVLCVLACWLAMALLKLIV